MPLSEDKLRRLQPGLYQLYGLHRLTRRPSKNQIAWRNLVRRQLTRGDARAAVVLSTDPLLVAAYTDELDAAVVLRYPNWLVPEYSLTPGRRLMTVNTYVRGFEIAPDIIVGPAPVARRWVNVTPMIAEFLTDDVDRIRTLHAGLDEREWERAESFGRRYLECHQGRTRDGRPDSTGLPAPTS